MMCINFFLKKVLFGIWSVLEWRPTSTGTVLFRYFCILLRVTRVLVTKYRAGYRGTVLVENTLFQEFKIPVPETRCCLPYSYLLV